MWQTLKKHKELVIFIIFIIAFGFSAYFIFSYWVNLQVKEGKIEKGEIKPCRWIGLQAKEFPIYEVKVQPIDLKRDRLVFEIYSSYNQSKLIDVKVNKIMAEGKEIDFKVLNISYSSLYFSDKESSRVTIFFSGLPENSCVEVYLTLSIANNNETEIKEISGIISGPN